MRVSTAAAIMAFTSGMIAFAAPLGTSGSPSLGSEAKAKRSPQIAAGACILVPGVEPGECNDAIVAPAEPVEEAPKLAARACALEPGADPTECNDAFVAPPEGVPEATGATSDINFIGGPAREKRDPQVGSCGSSGPLAVCDPLSLIESEDPPAQQRGRMIGQPVPAEAVQLDGLV